MQRINPRFYEDRLGIVIPMVRGLLEPSDYDTARDYTRRVSLGMDAQPTMVTQSSGGIPAYLTNYLDPEVIRVLTTPNRAAEIMGGEVKKGDWTMLTTQFQIVESTGEVSSYGDFNENGSAGVNVNYEDRQSYYFQTITQWGERELAIAGLGNIELATELNTSSAIVIDKFLNNSYFYGIAGLRNYGLLTDPSLSAPITPITKAATGTLWSVATPEEIFADLQKLFAQAVTNTRGLLTMNSAFTLAMSPAVEANMVKTNIYGLNVTDRMKKNFPNMKIETAVQYETAAGNLLQLIVNEFDGRRTAYPAFSEKMRAHAVRENGSSGWKQKKSAGTWGAIIRNPLAITSMIGV